MKCIHGSTILAVWMLIFPPIAGAFPHLSVDSTGWDSVPSILQSIIPPQFPDKDFLLPSFGAVGDGVTDCTQAFARAIDSCTAAGGGRIVVPVGIYLTGAIHLRSNVNLYVAKDATIKLRTDPAQYLPVVLTRFESTECMNYSPLIYAYGDSNIALTGEGLLDGQASSSNWWAWKSLSPADTTVLNTMVANGVPVDQRIFGAGHHLRPNFFQPYQCKNILVQGVTFKNSPMWCLNPVLSTNISIISDTLISTGSGQQNTDGCDPECCTNVLIKGCFFSNGDDCIAIKSGRNSDGRRVNVPCTNIVIQNCIMQNGHGGITIGSEMSGGVWNVFAENDTMNSPILQYALRFKTNTMRGGMIENIYERNISVITVSKYIISIDCNYGSETGTFIPVVRNLFFESVICTQAPNALYMVGLAASPMNNVVLTNCTFTNIKSVSNTIFNIINLQFTNVTTNGNILTSVDEKSGQNESPGHFLLQQNYPNPFNPTTTINYTVPEKTFVSGVLYTILGQEVQVLVHEVKQPGLYSVMVDGDNFPSGVYLCKFQAGNFVVTRKLLLLK